MSTVIEWLADSLVAGSIVMVIVMLVRGLALRRMPRRYAYLLWAVVAIRLLCPVILPSPVSVFNFVPEITLIQDHGTERSTPSTETIKPTRDITASQSDTKAVGSETYYKENTNESIEKPFTKQETRDTEVTTKNERKQPALAEKITPASVGEKETATEATGISTLLLILFVLWITGVVVFLSKNIIDGIRLQKKLCTAVRLEKGVYESDRIDTPFVKGIIRPRIYIPFRLSDTEKECILAHERHHIRRGDPVFKLIATVLLAVFWFHPLVWVSYRLMVRDMEMSCDEYVLAHETSDIRASYSTLLLAFATNRRIVDGVLFFGENDTKQRVKHIMGFKKKHVALGLIAILVVVMTSACTLTGKAVGESLKTNDIPDGEAVSGQAVSEKKDSSELELQEEVPSVSVSSSDMIGADMPEIIYNDANRLIVSCWKGVFVYDKNEHKIIRSLDRVALKCDYTQGDMYTSVHASDDGKYVYLDCEYYELQYQFDVDNNKLEKLEYKEDRWKTTDFFNNYGDWFKEDTTDVAWYMDPKGEKVYTNLVHMDFNLMCVGYYESKELAPTEEFPDPVQPRYIFTDEYTPQIDKKDELTKDDYSCLADICLDRIEGDTLIGHYSASTYEVYRYNVAMGNVCGFGSTEVYVKINPKTVFKIFDGKKDKEGHQKATKVSEKRFREYIKKHNNPGEPSYGIYDPEDPEHSTATRPGGPAYGGLRFGVEVEKGNCVSVKQLHQA